MPKQKLSEEERIIKQKQEKEWITQHWNKIQDTTMHHRIYNGNSNNLNFIENDSVDLIVTSPPYFNAKEYSQWSTIEEYLKDMTQIFSECYNKLKPGRKLCLNISDIPVKGEFGVKWLPLGSYIVKECEKYWL